MFDSYLNEKDTQPIIEDFKDDIGYNDDEFKDEEWYQDWKKGIEETIAFFLEMKDKNKKYFGNICNEMWRIMAAEPETILKYELQEDGFNSPVSVEIENGDYIFESNYDGASPIFFSLKKIY